MKIGDLIKAIGYQHLGKDQNGKVLSGWPDFLYKGIHRINKIKKNGFGILVKTDRQSEWININWFMKKE